MGHYLASKLPVAADLVPSPMRTNPVTERYLTILERQQPRVPNEWRQVKSLKVREDDPPCSHNGLLALLFGCVGHIKSQQNNFEDGKF